MKITSKSILSPNHHQLRDSTTAPLSLPPSLSRRLKTNRSLRGAQSPMFPTAAGKKPRSVFDNPEPSSPKVTCIGQVRVKTKKKKQGSKKQGVRTGEMSFRKIEGNVNANQKWVHLPLTICEALRGFGAEFSWCRPSCFSTGGPGERDKEGRGNGGDSSCVTVFGRWLVGLQGREIELVVGGEGEEREEEGGEIEIEDGRCGVSEECGVEVEEESRVSVCVPPKNALLLMRCRSDPVRVSALVNRFWESPIRSAEELEEEEEEEDLEGEGDGERLTEDKKVEAMRKLVSVDVEKEENPEARVRDLVMEGQEGAEERENTQVEVQDAAAEVQEEAEERESLEGELQGLEMEVQEEDEEGGNPEEILEISEESEEEGCEANDELEPVVVQEVKVSVDAEEKEVSCSSSEAFADMQRLENVEHPVEDYQSMEVQSAEIMSPDEDLFLGLQEMFCDDEEEAKMLEDTEDLSMGEEEPQMGEEREEVTQSEEAHIESEPTEEEEGEREGNGSLEREGELNKEQENRGKRSSLLPECLLLMMCEPKLSMEVSKETWVCSGDFIRWQPEGRKVKRTDGLDGPRRRVSIDSTAGPAATVSMAALIEQKLVNAVAYEPFVLTRCKSEPMRTGAAKLAPETWLWKNRMKLERLEPHRRATFGVGAAGVGF